MVKKNPFPIKLAHLSALGIASARSERVLHYLIIPLIYLSLWLVFLKDYQHIVYKDSISYISIAEKYARGDLIHAVNAFWPPLLSWLLAPLLSFGIRYDYAAKLLSLMIGIFVFLGVRSLSYTFELSVQVRNLLLLLLVPILVYCSHLFFNADLLLAGVLSFYFSIILSRDYTSNRHAGWLSGMLGAFAYFTKTYAFSFFLAHFLFANFIHYWSSDRRTVLRHCATGLAVFLGLSAIWVLSLYQKYHEVPFGILAKYNYAMSGPDSPRRPVYYIGFVPPADATATSIWEDPYYFPPIKSWSPFDSKRAFKHQLKLVWTNVKGTIGIYRGFSAFSLTIVVALLALCIGPLSSLPERIPIFLGLATLALYSAGYCLIYVEPRYFWPMLFLLICMGGYVLDLLFRTRTFESPGRKALLSLAFAASFLFTPLSELFSSKPWRATTATFSKLLEGEKLGGSKIASNTDYSSSVCVAYHLRAKYYGQAKENAPEAQVIQELRESGIEYYLVWDGAPVESQALEKIKELRAGNRILSIYSVRRREESP
jgi:hypothetical protein